MRGDSAWRRLSGFFQQRGKLTLGILVYRLLLRAKRFLALLAELAIQVSRHPFAQLQPFLLGDMLLAAQHGKPLVQLAAECALWQLAHLLDPAGRQCAIEQGQTDFTRFGLGGRFGRLGAGQGQQGGPGHLLILNINGLRF